MIAREGLAPAGVSLLLAGAAAGFDSISGTLAGAALTCMVLWIFNDRTRITPTVPLVLVAPVDGRVLHLDRRRDPWLERSSTRAVIRLPVLGMSVIRCPTEGQVREFWVRGGIGSDGSLDTASSPTLYALWLQTDEGDDVVVAVHGRRFISRFRADASPGERVGHGKRLGFIYFGTMVSVYAPSSAELCPPEDVPRRGRVAGGVDRLATLMRATATPVGEADDRTDEGAE